MFLANMSHEIRTPLNAILGFTEVIRQTDELSPGQLESLDQIERGGGELLALIETILDAARIEAGQLDLIRDQVSVQDLFDEAIEKCEDAVVVAPRAEPDAQQVLVGVRNRMHGAELRDAIEEAKEAVNY